MKAAILKAPGRLMLAEVAMPPCPDGGLVVKTQACSICSTDVKMFQRGYRDVHYPRTLGHEVAGVVVESRTPGDMFKAGDRVQIFPGICCGRCPACRRGIDNQCEHIGIIGFSHDGGFAEFLVVPPQSVAGGGVNLIPGGVSYDEAALAEPLASCLNGQQLAGVTEGDTVLILGAGPIGLLHAMLARIRGASRILIAERLPARLSMAGIAKIDRKIDVNRESTETIIQEETGGRGVDVILIACSEVMVSSLPGLLAPRGRLCLFSGLLPETAQIPLDTNLIHYKELTIVGAYGSTAAQNSAALRLIASGKVPVARLTTKRLSLDEIQEGIAYVANREGLKSIVTFS
ncbi:alcohol dehydrogenase catalytic domain-containing protein [Dehalococcoidia bacterium]|nr:alcohol dehydrogenase catalytic domain-containing protein [Dehalococcoidia bacterium]